MKSLIIFFLAMYCSLSAFATHLKGGYISAKPTNGRTYRITVHVYTDALSNVLFGGEDHVLDFGDGSSTTVPETQALLLEPELGYASFSIDHTYGSVGSYYIVYREMNRDDDVVNMSSSATTPFVLKTYITADPLLPRYATPDLLINPIFRAAIGSHFATGIATGDPGDLTLYYTPQKPIEADEYELPENYEINSMNGLITWDTRFKGSYVPGKYAFTIRISSISNDGILCGYMTLDFQITLVEIADTLSLTSNLQSENNRVFVSDDEQIAIEFFLTASQTAELTMTVYSEIEDAIGFTMYDSASANGTMTVGALMLNNSDLIKRSQPYVILVRGTAENEPVLYQDFVVLFFTEDRHKANFITGIEPPNVYSPHEAQAHIYPNPFEEFVQVNASTPTFRLTIYAADGRPVFDQQIENEQKINLGDLCGKHFIYRVTTPTRVTDGKLVKK